MRHNRPDYERFQDPVTICHKNGLPVGMWVAGPGYITAPDGTVIILTTAPDEDTNPLIFRLARAIVAMLSVPEDYCKGIPIPADEPVFIIRAQDSVSGNAVRAWADIYEHSGGDIETANAVRKHAAEMDAWPTKKLADRPS